MIQPPALETFWQNPSDASNKVLTTAAKKPQPATLASLKRLLNYVHARGEQLVAAKWHESMLVKHISCGLSVQYNT